MAFTMAGAETDSMRVIADLEWSAKHASGSNLRMANEVGLPIAQALRAFALRRHEECIGILRAFATWRHASEAAMRNATSSR